MIFIWLLASLWFPSGHKACLPRPTPLLDMKNLICVPTNLSYLLDNDILIISYDTKVNTLLATHLSSPTINISFGTFFLDICIIKDLSWTNTSQNTSLIIPLVEQMWIHLNE